MTNGYGRRQYARSMSTRSAGGRDAETRQTSTTVVESAAGQPARYLLTFSQQQHDDQYPITAAMASALLQAVTPATAGKCDGSDRVRRYPGVSLAPNDARGIGLATRKGERRYRLN